LFGNGGRPPFPALFAPQAMKETASGLTSFFVASCAFHPDYNRLSMLTGTTRPLPRHHSPTIRQTAFAFGPTLIYSSGAIQESREFITPSLRDSITPGLHHSGTPPLHHSIIP